MRQLYRDSDWDLSINPFPWVFGGPKENIPYILYLLYFLFPGLTPEYRGYSSKFIIDSPLYAQSRSALFLNWARFICGQTADAKAFISTLLFKLDPIRSPHTKQRTSSNSPSVGSPE